MKQLSNNKIALLFGICLGIDATILTAVSIFTNWYIDQSMLWFVLLIIPLQLIALILALIFGRKNQNDYLTQVILGLKVSLIGGLIAAATSLLFTTVIKPTYFEDIKAAGLKIYQQNPTPEMAQQILEYNKMANPTANALAGLAGSLICGLVFSLILAVPFRKKTSEILQ